MQTRHVIVAFALIVLAVAALRDFSRLGDALPWRTMLDFPDFYCAGWVLDRRADPYTYEPLHACEHRANRFGEFRAALFTANSGIAIPAPLPPYDFLPLMALARMPLDGARIMDALAILGAAALSAAMLAVLGAPFAVALAALALPVAYMQLNAGQIVPFALAALVLCGWALARGRDRLAGALAVVTAIEPIVGLPVILGTFCFVPRARLVAAVTAALLALASVAAGGPGLLVEYVARVVPAQAASEIHFPFQFSLTYALGYLNLTPQAARFAGATSYIVFLIAGLSMAPRVAQATTRRELLVFLPALCSLIGGAYLHQEELCFALPALLVLARYERGPAKMIFSGALCALSVPWIPVWGSKQLFLASVLMCTIVVIGLQVRLRTGLTLVCLIAAAIYCFELHPPHLTTPTVSTRAYGAEELVQAEWRDYAEERNTGDVLWLAIKFPAWIALVASFAAAASLRPQRLLRIDRFV